ncbi:MAG TPA: hypothetical protein VFW87_02530 [Pirellulales bacterium]|nr:hypothetical protein [Pirellulales bacterium]
MSASSQPPASEIAESSFGPRKDALSPSEWRRWCELPRFVVATFMAFGIALPWAVVMVVVLEAPVRQMADQPDQDFLQVRSDGTIVMQTYNYVTGFNTYRYIDGKASSRAEIENLMRLLKGDPRAVSPAEVEKFNQGQWLESTWLYSGLTDDVPRYRLPWQKRLMPFFLNKNGPAWFLVHDGWPNGHAYFAGYESRTRQPLGYLGTSGLVGAVPPVEQQFSIDSRRWLREGGIVSSQGNFDYSPSQGIHHPATLQYSSLFLLSGDAVWRVDFHRQTVEMLAEFPGAMTLVSAPARPASDAAEGRPVSERLLVRTKSSVEMIDLKGQPLGHWGIPPEAQSKDLRCWYDLGNGRVLTNYLRRMVGNNLELELLWLNAAGDLERRQAIEKSQGGINASQVWTDAPVIPMPAVLTALFYAAAPEVRGPEFSSTFAKTVAVFWPALLIVYVLSAALALLAYRRQRRYELPWAGAWAVFVLLLGLPGWLAYRWHRHWPTLAPCAECHRPAPRDREACAACGALFAPPPPTGAEMFA